MLSNKARYFSSIVVMALLFSQSPGESHGQEAVEFLGLQGKNITDLSLYPGVIAVGTDGNGVFWQYQSSLPESSWNLIGLESVSVQAVYAHKSGPIGWAISAGVAPEEAGAPFIYCSHLGGAFEPKSDGILNSLTNRISELDGFPDPTICGETFAAGDRALYRRAFTSSSWIPVYTTTIEGNFQTVKVNEQYPGVVLAGGADGFAGFLLIKSTDYGEHWRDISPVGMVYSVDFAGDSAEVIFAATLNHIYRSTDGGDTWEAVLDDEGVYRFTEVMYDPLTMRVYAAGGEGSDTPEPALFFSRDDGDSWHRFPLEMSGPIVDIEYDGDEWVYFATPNSGVFRVPQDVINVGVESESWTPETFWLTQNYPNPFNAITTIGYQISTATHVDIAVFNSLGKEVAQLVNRYQLPGIYSIDWSASDAGSGLYFYKMSVFGQSQVRKMLLIK